MKKILFYPLFMFLPLLSTSVCDIVEMQNSCFTGAFTSGYVFKHDDALFRDIYGFGMGNVITADGCYHPWRCWGIGIGAKMSYWLAVGKTTFFKRTTFLHEIPMTIYVRKMIDFRRGLRLYASLGGGAAWIKEKSNLGHTSQWRGLGEVEAGLIYPLWRRLIFTSAFRYLFPRQSQGSVKVDVGGFDLRAGLGFFF